MFKMMVIISKKTIGAKASVCLSVCLFASPLSTENTCRTPACAVLLFSVRRWLIPLSLLVRHDACCTFFIATFTIMPSQKGSQLLRRCISEVAWTFFWHNIPGSLFSCLFFTQKSFAVLLFSVAE